jgi:hypothetical protein
MTPFDGEMAPDSIEISLRKLLAFATIYPYDELDFRWGQTMSVAQISAHETIPGKAYWYRSLSAKEGKLLGYIRMNPGEFSKAEPTGDTIILDIPPFRGKAFTQELKECIEYVDKSGAKRISKEAQRLTARLKTFLQEKGSNERLFLQHFQQLHEKVVRCQSREAVEEIIGGEISDFWKSYSTNLIDFSYCIMLIQLQLEFGFVQSATLYKNPRQGFADVMHTLKEMGLLSGERMAGVANYYHEQGSNARTAALASGSLDRSTAYLQEAVHAYFCADSFADALDTLKIPYSFDYTRKLSDEGFACSLTALSHLHFITSSISSSIDELTAKFDVSDPDFEFNCINNLSSPTKPYIPRRLARTLAAAAICKGGNSNQARAAIADLLRMEEEAKHQLDSGIFDLWIIEMQLMNAYGILGDQKNQEIYAIRAVSKLMQSSPGEFPE